MIMDEAAINRVLARITHQIIERNNGVDGICLLGVKRRGIPLARMLAENINKFAGKAVPVGHLDITGHRDDLDVYGDVQVDDDACHIPCDIRDKTVIVVDDVIFTGRTARAAIEATFSYARPKALQLAVLIDRGHRELPIRADYVGKNVPTSKNEMIDVLFEEIDGESGVYICDRD